MWEDAQAPLPLDDRGLAYGDGLFETVLVRDGRPLLWEAHLARLARGCERLGFAMPEGLEALPAQAGVGLKVLKLIVTRGGGGRGYLAPETPSPRLRWQLSDFVPRPERWSGVRARHCALRLGIQPALAGLKHLNRLENVLARGEWSDPAIAEGLLCDSDGRLVEATCMNLVWRRGGRLETPDLSRCGVAGTLLAELGARHPIHRVRVGPEVLEEAEAVWLLNSVQGVWPLVRLDAADGRCLKRWSPGAVLGELPALAHPLLGYPAP
ncbi:aminodeoxychorismate lyase [Halomonas sp. H5]|uniref:aminodeoxychorismate lyase n=1 Tax=Halomonas sp. H5 TaxID=3423910 RepID=UPI003D36643F